MTDDKGVLGAIRSVVVSSEELSGWDAEASREWLENRYEAAFRGFDKLSHEAIRVPEGENPIAFFCELLNTQPANEEAP